MQFDQQIQSTVPNGVAPFLVASQTLVENLNARFLNGFGSSHFALANHEHTSSQITDSTAAGRTLLTSLNAGTQRADLGLGSRSTTIQAVASVNVSREEDPVGTPRPGIRFLEGSGVTISVSNDDAEDRYDVTISATAVGGNGDSRHTDYTSTSYAWPATGGIVICNSGTISEIRLDPPVSPANGTLITAIIDGPPAGASPRVYLPGGEFETLDNGSAMKTWVYSSHTGSWHKIVDID